MRRKVLEMKERIEDVDECASLDGSGLRSSTMILPSLAPICVKFHSLCSETCLCSKGMILKGSACRGVH